MVFLLEHRQKVPGRFICKVKQHKLNVGRIDKGVIEGRQKSKRREEGGW